MNKTQRIHHTWHFSYLVMAFLILGTTIFSSLSSVIQQPVFAAASTKFLTNPSTPRTDLAQSYTDYQSIQGCVQNDMYNNIYADPNSKGGVSVGQGSANDINDPSAYNNWFDNNSAWGYVYPSGKEDCSTIMNEAIKLWGFSSPQAFLLASGYKFSLNGPQYWTSNQGMDLLKKVDAAISNKIGGTPSQVGSAMYLIYLNGALLGNPDGNCSFHDYGKTSDLSSTDIHLQWGKTNSLQGNTQYEQMGLPDNGGITTPHIISYVPTVVTGSNTQKVGAQPISTTATLWGYQANYSANCTDIIAGLKSTALANSEWDKANGVKIENTSNSACETTDPSCNQKPPSTTDTCMIPGGAGWLICPVANTLANAIDSVYKHIIEPLLQIPPLNINTSDKNNELYLSWAAMRNIANIAFVIVFMVIIYSQITSAGVSNYGIKKLLPRLIVAAILVNLSFWICVLAVDISNILGSSIDGLLTAIMTQSTNNLNTVPLWADITSATLSAGAGAGTGLVIGSATVAFPEVALWLILPLALGAFLAVITALFILALRQALVVILVFISPLAFVAYLLPNTEKWFHKWREGLTTLLILYPIIAAVFAGSRLAASILFTAAITSKPTQWLLVVIAMFIEVAPLALTPLLVKFSGGLLGNIANAVRGRAKNTTGKLGAFARDQRKLGYMKRMSTGATATGFGSTWRRAAARFDGYRRKQKTQGSQYENQAENQYQSSEKGRTALQALNVSEKELEITKNKVGTYLEDNLSADLKLNLEVSKIGLEKAKAKTKQLSEEFVAGSNAPTGLGPLTEAQTALQEEAIHAHEDLTAINTATSTAQNVQHQEFAKQVSENAELANRAAGIDPNGAARVVAEARAVVNKATQETIKNIEATVPFAERTNVAGLAQKLEVAAANGQVAEVAAYSNLLGAAGNPGIEAFKKAFNNVEANTIVSAETIDGAKELIAQNSSLTGAGKDIENWATSQYETDAAGNLTNIRTTLVNQTNKASTWAGISNAAFANMKPVSQLKALQSYVDTNNIDKVRAMYEDRVLMNNLKEPARLKVIDIIDQADKNTGNSSGTPA